MQKTHKSKQKKVNRRRTSKKTRTSKRKNVMMRGGNNVVYPATFSNEIASVSPQSYLPYNNFSNDPGYLVVNSRNTGPFLTGVVSGGKGRRKHTMKKRGRKIMHGGLNSGISSAVNSVTNGVGIIPSPALNEMSGVSGVMSAFSETGSSYSPVPVKIAPLS